jgi:ABC-type Fe3+ transport system permease subunit
LFAAVAHPLYRQGLLNSLAIACVTTLLTAVLALPVALVMARYRFRGRGWWRRCC